MSVPPEEHRRVWREAWEEAKKDKAERRRQNRERWLQRKDWTSDNEGQSSMQILSSLMAIASRGLYLQRTRFESIAERKLRWCQLTDDRNVEISSRYLGRVPDEALPIARDRLNSTLSGPSMPRPPVAPMLGETK